MELTAATVDAAVTGRGLSGTVPLARLKQQAIS
jgi:hypothetical protein